jgi:hypothetical protein
MLELAPSCILATFKVGLFIEGATSLEFKPNETLAV